MKNKYTDIQIQFLKNNVKGITLKKLTEMFNKEFNKNISESSIAHLKNKYNLKSGIIGGQFKKGNESFNKGKKWDDYMSEKGKKNSLKTTFKKGNTPHNYRKIGSCRTTKDGYIEIKIKNPDVWVCKHRYIYEKEKGKILEGHTIIFADNNKRNFNINNLIMISRAEELLLNQNNMRFNDIELTNSAVMIAKNINKMNKIIKENL